MERLGMKQNKKNVGENQTFSWCRAAHFEGWAGEVDRPAQRKRIGLNSVIPGALKHFGNRGRVSGAVY